MIGEAACVGLDWTLCGWFRGASIAQVRRSRKDKKKRAAEAAPGVAFTQPFATQPGVPHAALRPSYRFG